MSPFQAAGGKKLGTQGGILSVVAAPHGGAGHGGFLAHAAHGNAHMVGLQVDCHAVRLEHGFQGVSHLLPNALALFALRCDLYTGAILFWLAAVGVVAFISWIAPTEEDNQGESERLKWLTAFSKVRLQTTSRRK